MDAGATEAYERVGAAAIAAAGRWLSTQRETPWTTHRSRCRQHQTR